MSCSATLLYDEVGYGQYMGNVQKKPHKGKTQKSKPKAKHFSVDICLPADELQNGATYTSTVNISVEEGVIMDAHKAQIKWIEGSMAAFGLIALIFLFLLATDKMPKYAAGVGFLMSAVTLVALAREKKVRGRDEI